MKAPLYPARSCSSKRGPVWRRRSLSRQRRRLGQICSPELHAARVSTRSGARETVPRPAVDGRARCVTVVDDPITLTGVVSAKLWWPAKTASVASWMSVAWHETSRMPPEVCVVEFMLPVLAFALEPGVKANVGHRACTRRDQQSSTSSRFRGASSRDEHAPSSLAAASASHHEAAASLLHQVQSVHGGSVARQTHLQVPWLECWRQRRARTLRPPPPRTEEQPQA